MKKILMGITVASFVLTFAGASIAAMSWDTCGIKQIGAAGDADNLLKVTACGVAANNDKWLKLVKQKDTAMATMLTAFSLDKKVKLNADFAAGNTSGSAYGPVETIYLSK